MHYTEDTNKSNYLIFVRFYFVAMIASCGGKALLRPSAKLSEKTIIISHQDDLDNARKLLSKVPKNVTIQSTEFLLIGILKQELDFVRHKLI